MKYVCNGSNFSYNVCGVDIYRRKATPVEEGVLANMRRNFMFTNLVKSGAVTVEDAVPDKYKTTGQQLTESNAKLSEVSSELETVKKEALDTIAAKDAEIAALKAKLAEIKK